MGHVTSFNQCALICTTVLLAVACDKPVSSRERPSPESRTSDVAELVPEGALRATNTDGGSEAAASNNTGEITSATADMNLVMQLADSFRDSYETGYGVKPATLETIALARALRTNMTLSAGQKVDLITGRLPSSMASKGAELALYLSELNREDLTPEDRARLTRNISSIYAQFDHTDAAIEYLRQTADIYAELKRRLDLALTYECLGDCYFHGKDEPVIALSFYKKVLKEAKGLKEYDHEWLQDTILTMLAQRDDREEVKRLYEEYSEGRSDAFPGALYYLNNPGVKVRRGKCTIGILGDSSEIDGLPELRQRGNAVEINTFLNRALREMLESEQQRWLSWNRAESDK